ncbi:hypothetical protein [Mucilaginibacter boryungensis]|uniref:Uncharacterized protein n=1 Tax=Mucilaginibacter boryungensis TaxID=768480 RepID=A0ABR9XHX7_9SPHI|nr:hypothetical protein [Mucilaginibacter boryungensis]MBE9666613.1 hypothetical protein [Mucilaginibacter boryungensis]
MPTKSYLSFAGFVVLIAATYCPLLRPFGLRSFDLYQLNQPYGLLLLLIGVIGILGIILRQRAIVRLCAWFALILVIVLYIAALFKIHHFFGFIPFKSIVGFLTRQIRFKWGWFLLFGGPILAIIGVFTTKRSAVPPVNKEK